MAGVSAKQLEIEALKAETAAEDASQAKERLEASIRAAELYMQALNIASNPSHKKYLDAKCKSLVRKAEEVKSSISKIDSETKSDPPPQPPRQSDYGRPRILKAPTSSRPLSKSEQILLWRGSSLNGFKFPPWDENAPPDKKEFELSETGEIFEDGPGLLLSSSQMETFNGWKRPNDLYTLELFDQASKNGDLATMVAQNKCDLIQDLTSDCSVVASLCAGTSRAEKGHSRILSSMIHPYDHKIQYPLLSANGKYIFRLYFNGCFRKVVVDDRLPSSKTSRTLHIVDRNNPGLLWPALLEKAYLKVRGGYDFPGSNSGTDLWVLHNWIPEQIFLHNGEVDPEQLWLRLFSAFNYGDVLLTIGTGKLSRKEERQTGLAGEHDYAVLDLKEEGYRRMVLIKNPWSEGTVWKGAQLESMAELAEDNRFEERTSDKLQPGTFWMSLTQMFQYFESLYLNWNPGLFSYRQDVHFSWDLAGISSVPGCVAQNPQYTVKTKGNTILWLLLSRHFKTGDYIHATGQGPDSLDQSEPGFISLYAFKKSGKRVILSDGAAHRGQFVDSPNTLLRFDMPVASTYTVVVLEQYLPRAAFTFSLSAFSLEPIILSETQDKYPYSSAIHAAWTTSTAGGNADSATYTSNPQFNLQILAMSSDAAILVETEHADLPVHIKLFYSRGNRVISVRSRDIIADSGDYRRGCALLETAGLEKGSYTIVCSTFARDQLSKFTLRVSTTTNSVTEPLPAEGAGRLRLTPPAVTFPAGTERVLAPLTPKRLTRIRLTAQHAQPATPKTPIRRSNQSPLKISLELGQGPYKRTLAVSNEDDFTDAATGARIEDIDLMPDLVNQGGIWLVVQRLGSSAVEVIGVEAFSEENVEIGDWGTGDG